MESRKATDGPLAGIRILDFTRLYPGPLGTRLMAVLGAEVIKIEDVRHPDPMRFYPPFLGEESAGYVAVNHGKQILNLDFSSADGQEQLAELIRTADVLVEQFRPGVMRELGLDYESVRQYNPKLIYVSLTGYGQSGPMAQQAGHDINYIGYAGILSLTGNPKAGPVLPGVQIADVAGGAYWLIIRTLAALWQRQRTGEGEHVDVAMLEGTLPLITLQWAQYHASGQRSGPGEHPLAGGLPNYNVYRCKDGKYLALGALEQKFWEAFCDLVERPEWKPLHFAMGKEGERLKKALQKLFQQRTREEWLALAEGKDVCLSPVLELEEVKEHIMKWPYRWMRRLLTDWWK